jgi:hypothetical protein
MLRTTLLPIVPLPGSPAAPLAELRRLVRLRRACNLEDAGDNAIAGQRPAPGA